MNTKLAFIVSMLVMLALDSTAWARGLSKHKVSRPSSSRSHKVSRPSTSHKISRPSTSHKISRPRPSTSHKVSRPSTSHKISRPSSSSGSRLSHITKPSTRPATRPSTRPAIKPSTRPSTKPSVKPSTRPQQVKPKLPSGGGHGSGSGLPSLDGGGKGDSHLGSKFQKPDTRPAIVHKPGDRPKLPSHEGGGGGIRDFLGIKGDGGGPGGGKGKLPGRPGGDHNLSIAGGKGNGPRWKTGDITSNRVGGGIHMNFNPDHRPGHPDRPARPKLPEKWQNIHSNNVNQWSNWRQKNEININRFQFNRTNNWNHINQHWHDHGWASHFGSGDYRRWRHDVMDFRRNRCEEIWHHRQPFWDNCFDNHWWGSCWWRPRPFIPLPGISPWWWWRPFAWASAGAFFGAALAPQPIVYDPGTTVIYEGDTYYVDGKAAGSATEARQAAVALATPEVEEPPIPDPAPEGQPEEWLPLGVWALTQQEQGDATMFMQFSVNKEGLIGGAYKNVMTGDEQPIVGQLDKETQRIAWHVGDVTQTVYETGLSSVENDVASIFVHFGEDSTQTWLLVRLPSPEMPPGSVKLPEIEK